MMQRCTQCGQSYGWDGDTYHGHLHDNDLDAIIAAQKVQREFTNYRRHNLSEAFRLFGSVTAPEYEI